MNAAVKRSSSGSALDDAADATSAVQKKTFQSGEHEDNAQKSRARVRQFPHSRLIRVVAKGSDIPGPLLGGLSKSVGR